MQERLCQLEFGVSCLGDMRSLLKAWQQVRTLEGMGSTEAGLVHVILEDRQPGEEIRLVFQASQRVIARFLSILTDGGFTYLCKDLLPGLLTVCRVIKDRRGL